MRTTTNTVSRQEKVDFSLPIWVDGATFVVKVDSAIKTHADLGGKKVAVMAHHHRIGAETALANSYVNAEVILVKSHVDGLELCQGQGRCLRVGQHGAHRFGVLAVRQTAAAVHEACSPNITD